MDTVQNNFVDLERHRLQLEQNVEKLSAALSQWRLWEAEYEALKDEIDSLPKPIALRDLAKIRQEFDGQLVTPEEVREILGEDAIEPLASIYSVLSGRLNVASANITALEGQLEAAEQKLAVADVVTYPDGGDEDGLPITDIVEELDDDDQVKSFRLQQQGDVRPQILEALEKAGIKDLPGDGERPKRLVANAQDEVHTAAANSPVSLKSKKEDKPRKRAVSFAEDTKPGHEPPQKGQTVSAQVKELMRKVDSQAMPITNPIVPTDESAEDAEMRREMLKYGMTEIAPIVAQLDLEEADSDYDFDNDDWAAGSEAEASDDDEDDHGRAQYSVIDDEYRKRMEALQERLGVKRMQPKTAAELNSPSDEGIGRITITRGTEQGGAERSSTGKTVRFADSLDVAEAKDTATHITEPPAASQQSTHTTTDPVEDPVRDIIVERVHQPPQPSQPETRKPSKFKQARNGKTPSVTAPVATLPFRGPHEAPVRFLDDNIRIAPSGPEGRPSAAKIVERDTPEHVEEPDGFDATMLHREAATEYHRMRNRMIQKDGGFMRQNEDPILPPDEEEEGRPMSRFKAARLSRR